MKKIAVKNEKQKLMQAKKMWIPNCVGRSTGSMVGNIP